MVHLSLWIGLTISTILFARQHRHLYYYAAQTFHYSKITGFYLAHNPAAEVITMSRSDATSFRRTIRRTQLREMVPLADSTIYEMEQRGEFPRRFALSPRCIVWDLAEVQAWLESRRAIPVKRAKHPNVRQRKTRPVKEPDQTQAAS